MGWSKFQTGLMLLSREVNPCRFIFHTRTLTAPGKQHVPRPFFVWDFEDGHIQGPRPQSPCDKGGLLLLESMLYFRKCWVLCTSLLPGLSCQTKSALIQHFPIVYSDWGAGLKITFSTLDKALDDITQDQLFGDYTVYTMLFYILTLGPWSGCPLSGKFYPRSSLLLIQISVSPSLTNAMSRPVHSCVFYFQSSHHSYEMILFTFLFPCWIPLSYQNVSPTRAGTCLINPASLGPKTVPGPLKHSAFFFFFLAVLVDK